MNYCISTTACNVKYQININGKQPSTRHFKICFHITMYFTSWKYIAKLSCCIQWCDNSSWYAIRSIAYYFQSLAKVHAAEHCAVLDAAGSAQRNTGCSCPVKSRYVEAGIVFKWICPEREKSKCKNCENMFKFCSAAFMIRSNLIVHVSMSSLLTSPTALVRIWMILSCGVATTLCPFISMMRWPTRMPPLSAIPPRIRLQICNRKRAFRF